MIATTQLQIKPAVDYFLLSKIAVQKIHSVFSDEAIEIALKKLQYRGQEGKNHIYFVGGFTVDESESYGDMVLQISESELNGDDLRSVFSPDEEF